MTRIKVHLAKYQGANPCNCARKRSAREESDLRGTQHFRGGQTIAVSTWPLVSDCDSKVESAESRPQDNPANYDGNSVIEEFSIYEAYAQKYVEELCEFGSIKHCWSVELDRSHHNEALIEYSDWLVLIQLSGVTRGLLA